MNEPYDNVVAALNAEIQRRKEAEAMAHRLGMALANCETSWDLTQLKSSGLWAAWCDYKEWRDQS